MPELNEARLAEIQERCEKATPGPWNADEYAHEATPYSRRRVYRVEIVKPIHHPISGKRYASRHIAQIVDYCEWTDSPANREFILHAREDMPDLLAELTRLRAENERLRAAEDTDA